MNHFGYGSPGCATGEEAYSMCYLFTRIFRGQGSGDENPNFRHRLFPKQQLLKQGLVYTGGDTAIWQKFPTLVFHQFFTKSDGSYQVNKAIRDMCVFANHNLLKDPPFSKVDLVSCRNVMIYLEPILQKRALNTFHYALK